MNIVALETYIADLLHSFGLSEQVVGVSHRSKFSPQEKPLPFVTGERSKTNNVNSLVDPRISQDAILIDELKTIRPEVIVASVYSERPEEVVSAKELQALQDKLESLLGFKCKLFSYAPRRLDEIYEGSADLAKALHVPFRGDDLGKKAKAQLMDWGDNFYERMKNKKVTFISSLQPLTLGGLWIPDMIHVLSAHSQVPVPAFVHPPASWDSILEFKPDVIVVALKGQTLKEATSSFKLLEKMQGWDELPAVKRGEVVFCDGLDHFYDPGPKIIDSFGVMVSAIAGLESGYITKRDTFYRLRWLELQRHRL